MLPPPNHVPTSMTISGFLAANTKALVKKLTLSWRKLTLNNFAHGFNGYLDSRRDEKGQYLGNGPEWQDARKKFTISQPNSSFSPKAGLNKSVKKSGGWLCHTPSPQSPSHNDAPPSFLNASGPIREDVRR